MFPDLVKALVAFIALGSLTWPSVAWSCRCGSTPGFYPFNLPLIFVGKVATVERVGVDPKTGYEDYNTACLDSEFSLYGVPPDNRRVCVATDRSDCRVKFQVGEHYMVFAEEPKDAPIDAGLPYTEQCMGTRLLRPVSTPLARSTPFLPVLVASLVSFAVGLFVRGRRRK